VSRVRVSRVSSRVRVRVRVGFMIWVRGNVREGKCPGKRPTLNSETIMGLATLSGSKVGFEASD